ncbi:MAG: hypothetical protein NUV53_01115 [Patescibacteria group bacterium]|nr:hypothetical protein [Patescibacteria group bacterium]
MSERITAITVTCKCGQKLFKYQKAGTGRLIKCFIARILADYTGIPEKIGLGIAVLCPACGGRVGTTQRIHGSVAIKLNQGQIQGVRIG